MNSTIKVSVKVAEVLNQPNENSDTKKTLDNTYKQN